MIKNIDIDLKLVNKDDFFIISKNDIDFVKHETVNDIKAVDFHNTIIKWIKDKRPFAMDIDKGTQVWNYSFGKVLIKEISKDKLSKEETEQYQKLQNQYSILYRIRILHTQLFKSDDEIEHYKYWLVEDFRKNIVSSGWISANKPDFMWRCQLKPTWQNIKINPRNPYVTPYYVNQLYLRSL